MHVLRLQCEDKPGIVAAVAATLSNNQCNIEESSQFFDPYSGRFFMRVVFRALEQGCLQGFLNDFPDNAVRFAMDWEVCDMDVPVRTLVLVSTADHCLHDLLYRVSAKGLALDIAAVVSNHETLGPMTRQAGIPFYHLPIGPDSKAGQEGKIEELAAKTGCELIVLARYMQVLSQKMCSKYPGRVINIHHSFLPGFKGARPYQQAYERGVKIIGATAHFATEDLDEGPIISQGIEPVDHEAVPPKLQQIGKDIETRVLARALQLYAERRVFLNGNRTVIL